jgi:hypothetical protein
LRAVSVRDGRADPAGRGGPNVMPRIHENRKPRGPGTSPWCPISLVTSRVQNEDPGPARGCGFAKKMAGNVEKGEAAAAPPGASRSPLR